MWDSYSYRKAIRRHWYSKYRLRLYVVAAFILILIAAGIAIILDLQNTDKKGPGPTSKIQNIIVANQLTTFTSPYFKFQDTGKWVLDTQHSTPTKFVYTKFMGLDPQYQLTIYVNEVPIPLDLAVSRVLPVRIVNGNSFDVTQVSNDCASYYAPTDAHRIETISVNEASMLCDPDTPKYNVVLSQIAGNYQLPMQRADGTPIKFVIIYYDGTITPSGDRLINIMNTFKAR